MSLIGKRLIVVGASWGDVSIGKLHASLTSSTIQPSGTTTVTAWVNSDVTVTTCTCTSSSTATATVSERSGSGTQASPFSWTITGVANGTTTLSVVLNSGLATQETKTLILTVGSAPVTTYTVGGAVTNGTPATLTTATVSAGGSTTFTITPDTGFALAAEDITVTGTASKSVSGNVVTISNVQSNVTLAIACHQSTGEVTWYSETALLTGTPSQMVKNAAAIAPSETYMSAIRNKSLNRIRFRNGTALSGTLTLIRCASQGATSATDICSLPWTATSSNSVVVLSLPETITFTGTEFVGFAKWADVGDNTEYVTMVGTEYQLYTRVPDMPSGQGTGPWSSGGASVMFDFGYAD